MVNSRLGHFTAAPHGALLLPKLRSHFAEFLGCSSLAHLRILSLPMCVHFRYGPCRVIARSFSREPASRSSVLAAAFRPLHVFPLSDADFPASRVPRLVQLFRQLVALALSVTPSPLQGYWNIRQSSIGYALRPRLRSRLTQGGRAFPWNPWAIGAWDSHPRAATHAGILSSIRSTGPLGPASPLMQCSPTISADIHSFGVMLSPGKLSARSHSTSELLRTL